jgi:hypothetical protein
MAKKIFRSLSEDGAESDAEVATMSEPSRIAEAVVRVPVLAGLTGYAGREPGVILTGPQALTLKSVTEALSRQGATLENGHRVKYQRDALAWILEQIAAA